MYAQPLQKNRTDTRGGNLAGQVISTQHLGHCEQCNVQLQTVLEPSTSVKRFSESRPAGQADETLLPKPSPPGFGGDTRTRESGYRYLIHLPIGCRRASVSSRVPAAESSNSSSSHGRCTSTSVVRWRTSVPHTHTHTHTRRHERCPWCRRRRVSSSSNGGGTGQERYTGNTIHRGGSRVVAHHRAYQYGTRYIGRSHARTSTHALTLSRAATAARASSRTRTHRRSGARAPTS